MNGAKKKVRRRDHSRESTELMTLIPENVGLNLISFASLPLPDQLTVDVQMFSDPEPTLHIIPESLMTPGDESNG
jgi:hypothetical protein